MNPCIPATWDGFTIQYRFQTATYVISVRNPAHVEHGVKSQRGWRNIANGVVEFKG